MRRCTEDERARIVELAEAGKNSGQIARALGLHQSTVTWRLYSEGLKAPRPRETVTPYQRGTVTVYRFSAEEDAFIEALRIQGIPIERIASASSKRFGIRRTSRSVRCRLIMLAAREAA